MSKILFLVRHAKSSWDNSMLKDYERPLLNSGIERTGRVVQFLKSSAHRPDLIIASHAVRALETAKLLASGLDYPNHEILIESGIYYADADGLYDLVLALPDSKDAVMLVGHNPSMTQFANMFLDQKIDYLPTTGVACIGFESDDWAGIALAERRVIFFVTPKMLKDR